ncbi:hypothetical protein BZG35_03565 [Brevundimonas sp. LM2]|nr:hypothetical protein BZG35_03565 [Brevundimonas sp. LM2]
MSGKDTLITKKRRGPAPTGQGQLIGVRLQPDALAMLDRWIGSRGKDESRPEAIRKLLTLALAAEGVG